MGNCLSDNPEILLADNEGSDQLDFIITQAIDAKIKDKKQLYLSLFQSAMKDSMSDRALGCVFGSFIGDALGAYC